MVQDRVSHCSKLLFGNRHLLAVAATIADLGPEVRARQIEASIGLAPSTVHRSLAALSAASLLARLPREPGQRDQAYARAVHPFWDAARTLQADALREGSK